MKTKISKSVKRFLASFIAVAIVLCSAPLSGFAGLKLPDWINFGWLTQTASAAETSGKCGDNLTWTFNDGTGKLIISGIGEMYYYGDYPWRENSSIIKEVVINNGVTSIGDEAFYSCNKLAKITIPNSVTRIASYAFSNCNVLKSITIPNSVKSIGEWAFGNCDGLTGITIPDSVKSIGESAFGDCDGLTGIKIGNGVTDIGAFAFFRCSHLANVIIPGNVTNIGSNVFNNCCLLKSVTIKNGVKSIGSYAFSQCESLKNITIPSSVTSIGYRAFEETAYYYNVSNWDNGALYINDCLVNFDNSITGIYYIKDGTRIISSFAFYDCKGLTSITIPESIISIGDCAFYSCPALTSINVDSKNKFYSNDSYGAFFNKSKTYLLQYPIGNTRTSYTIPDGITIIGEGAFGVCSMLTSITIPDSLTGICESAFKGCSSLKDVYYLGTKEQFEEIIIRKYNTEFLNATIHYNGVRTINFDANGGTVSETIRKVENGKAVGTLPIPLREGYSFDGWYSSETKVNESTVVCNDVTYIAHWTINTYKVLFDANSGIVEPTSKDVEYGKVVGTLPIPSREGYSFDGWYSSETKVNESTAVCKDVTYIAHWTINTYKVLFDANSGIVEPTSKNIEYGKAVGTLPMPSREGYSFDGWYFGKTKVTESTVVKNNVTYTARWKAYNIISVSVSDISMDYKNTVKLMSKITADSSANYTVSYSSSDNSVATVDENGNVYGAKKGSAIITCTVTDSNGNTASDTCNVDVNYSFVQWLIKILLFGWIWY